MGLQASDSINAGSFFGSSQEVLTADDISRRNGQEEHSHPEEGEALPRRQKILISTALLASIALGGGGTAITISRSRSNRSSYPRFLSDEALNTTVDHYSLLTMHNAGAIKKGGTPVIATSQSLSVRDALEETPVRGLAIDLHYHQGKIIVNHGKFINTLWGKPILAEDIFTDINSWLDQPGNGFEFVVLEFESYVSQSELNQLLRQSFTNKLTSINRFNPKTTTMLDLIKSGRVILDWPGDFFWEDRSMIGRLGTETLAPFSGRGKYNPKPFTTNNIEQMLNKGLLIGLDQINGNDPRLDLSQKRGHPFRPDITIAELFYVGNPKWRDILFGLGISTSVATGLLAILGAFFSLSRQKNFFQALEKSLFNQLTTASIGQLAAMCSKEELSERRLSIRIVKDAVSNQWQKMIKRWTLAVGCATTLSLSGSLLGLSRLFPQQIELFSWLSSIVILSGVSYTIFQIHSLGNRARTVLEKILNSQKFDAMLKTRIEYWQRIISSGLIPEHPVHPQSTAKKMINQLPLATKIALRFLGLSTFMRVSAAAKIEPSILVKVSTSCFDFLTLLGVSFLGSRLNLRSQDIMRDLSTALKSALTIDRTNPDSCFKANLQKFHQTKNRRSELPTNIENLKEIMIQFAIDQLKKKTLNPSFWSGIKNTFLTSGIIATMGLVYPSITGFFWLTAILTLPAGFSMVYWREKKFRRQIFSLLHSAKKSESWAETDINLKSVNALLNQLINERQQDQNT